MTFAEYVDQLAKRGVIDGNIAEHLCGLHRDETQRPKEAVAKRLNEALNTVLGEMYDEAGEEYHEYANRITDALDAIDW